MTGARRTAMIMLLAAVMATAAVASAAEFDRLAEEAEARALFERNLEAISRGDREEYLSCYLQSEGLVRNGFEGIQRGFTSLAAGTDGSNWPSFFEAKELQVFSIHPGVVYGSYHYRVRFAQEEEDVQEGISERLFVKTEDGWRIAVTTAFAAPPVAISSPRDSDQR